jgi:sec-independent protein translocase protein TatA
MELIIVLVVILLLFGAKRIPELARGLGSGVREFKAGTKEGQLEDKKDKEKADEEEGVTSEVKLEDETKLEAEKAEQKRS